MTSTGLLVVIDGKVGLRQAGDKTARAVSDGDRDVDELDAAPEAKSVLRAQLAERDPHHGSRDRECRRATSEEMSMWFGDRRRQKACPRCSPE